MYNQDGRNGYSGPHFTGTDYAARPMNGAPTAEWNHLAQTIEHLRWQLHSLTEYVRHGHGYGFGQAINMGRGYGYTAPHAYTQWNGVTGTPTTGHFAGTYTDNNCMRVRETTAYLCWEISLPELSITDYEVEVFGNRIVCRTRTALSAHARRDFLTYFGRGMECFELPDGRIEFQFVAPIAFQPKDVEATWREGFLCVYIPKLDTLQRQSVKIVKDNGARKAANDLNS